MEFYTRPSLTKQSTQQTTFRSPITFHFSPMATRRTQSLDLNDKIDADLCLASPVLSSSSSLRIPRVVVTPARKWNLVRNLKLSSSSSTEDFVDDFYFPSGTLEGRQREGHVKFRGSLGIAQDKIEDSGQLDSRKWGFLPRKRSNSLSDCVRTQYLRVDCEACFHSLRNKRLRGKRWASPDEKTPEPSFPESKRLVPCKFLSPGR